MLYMEMVKGSVTAQMVSSMFSCLIQRYPGIKPPSKYMEKMHRAITTLPPMKFFRESA